MQENIYIATIINNPIKSLKNKPIIKFIDENKQIISGPVVNMGCSQWCKGQNIYIKYENNKIYSIDHTDDILKKENKGEKFFFFLTLIITILVVAFSIYKVIITTKFFYFLLLVASIFIFNICTVFIVIKMAKKNIDKIDNYNKLTEGRIIAIKPIVREDSMSDTTVCLNERKYMYEYCVKGKFLYNIEYFLDPSLYNNYKVGDRIQISYNELKPLESCFKDVYEWKKNKKTIETTNSLNFNNFSINQIMVKKTTQATIVNIVNKKLDIKDSSPDKDNIYTEAWIECNYKVNNFEYTSFAKYPVDQEVYHIGDKITIAYLIENPKEIYII